MFMSHCGRGTRWLVAEPCLARIDAADAVREHRGRGVLLNDPSNAQADSLPERKADGPPAGTQPDWRATAIAEARPLGQYGSAKDTCTAFSS